jgi:large subunit ribosomal protein L4
LPRKAKKLALRAALSGKVGDGEVTVVDAIRMEKPSTRDMAALLRGLELEGKSTLIVISEYDKSVLLSSRNIPGVTVRRVADLNTYDVMVHSRLLVTKDAAELLAEAGKK